MINNMALSGLRENVILTKLYLPQMALMDVYRETQGAKGGCGTPLGRTILTTVVGVMQAMWPPALQMGVWTHSGDN